MVVGPDPAALADWALRLGELMSEHPRPRAAVHYGYCALPRRRLLRRRRQPRCARAGGVGRGGGAGHAAGGRGERSRAALRAGCRRASAGLQRAHRAVPRARRGAGVSVADEIVASVRDEGLLVAGRPVVVMLSGGRDSTCLLDVAVTVAGAAAVTALHVNYGLRDAAGDDEQHCRSLCQRFGVELAVIRLTRPTPALGNLQAWARRARYDAAAQLSRDAWGGRRGRTHRHRPGRNDPVSAGVLAEPASAARDASARRPRWSDPCSASRASRPGPTASSAGWNGATMSPTTPTSTRAGACATAWCRRCARSTRGPSATCSRWRRRCATRPMCWTRWSTRSSAAVRRSSFGACASCTWRSRGWLSSVSPIRSAAARRQALPAG